MFHNLLEVAVRICTVGYDRHSDYTRNCFWRSGDMLEAFNAESEVTGRFGHGDVCYDCTELFDHAQVRCLQK